MNFQINYDTINNFQELTYFNRVLIQGNIAC